MNKQYINEDTTRIYNPDKFSWLKRVECSPSILDNDTLMSADGDFMNKAKIDKECQCTRKDTCKAIVDLLDHKKPELARDLLK